MFRWDEDRLPPATATERKHRHRAKRKAAGLPGNKPYQDEIRPFMGIDGEGAGIDALGRQNYLLLRAGPDAELFRDGAPLTTEQCLDFICDLPAAPILVGFAFGYDATMILRDLPQERLDLLFLSEAERGQRGINSRYTFFRDFGIEYLPRQFFRVARMRKGRSIPGSCRTVYETFGNFQCSFLKALTQFKIGDVVTRELIERHKAMRSDFATITPDIQEYCGKECELLAELMEEFRRMCHAGGIRPRTWNGAGKLAAALHIEHSTIRRTDLVLPRELTTFASNAYYGGRFEVTRIGDIAGPIHEYDIRSAYPAAMQTLPCLKHGKWAPVAIPDPASLYVAFCSFSHSKTATLCGLPHRSKQYRLSWPRQGRGTYWSVEIEAARRLGAMIDIEAAWEYEPECDCKPFAWVEQLYEYRRSIGSATAGYPIKLGINSLYGKLAQRIGDNPPWQNFVWAGLITAQTRAWLAEAASQAPADILMLATDGIYSRVPLDLPIGEQLGQWEHAEHPRMFVVQPGLYWGPPKPKTRGVPRGFFQPHTGRFEAAWAEYMEYEKAAFGPLGRAERIPAVTLPLTNFIGLRLAHSRGKPQTAGVWSKDQRTISFDWSAKRGLASARPIDGAMATKPLSGDPDCVSLSHTTAGDIFSTMASEMAVLTEAMPDFVDFGPPGF